MGRIVKKDEEEACRILSSYNGPNPWVKYLKYIFEKRGNSLDEFNVKYILSNYDYEPDVVNRTVNITVDFGKRLKEKYDLEFTPVKLYIGKIIGEMGNSLHCYAQFRRSVPAKLMYVRRNDIVDTLKVIETTDVEVDFDKYDKKTEKYNRKLKEHQREGVKFLLANKKCILADSPGMGKTATLTVSALETGCAHILVVCPASLKTNWKREICFYDDEENVTILTGGNWKEHTKWTIVNYEILKNFYEIPMVMVYENQYVEDENGNFVIKKVPVMEKAKNSDKMVPKMRKSNNKQLIKECMANSPLFQEKFDCVIIDEAHKLSNNKSGRYKILSDFFKRSNPQYIFLTTGTPLTNRPINLYHILNLLKADVTRDYKYYVMRYCGGKEMHLRTGKTITLVNGATNLGELREKIKHLYIRRLLSDMRDMVGKRIVTKFYDLSDMQFERYQQLWDEYVEQKKEEREDCDEYRQLVEGILVRQYLATEMAKNTMDIVDEYIEGGEKVVIICQFQAEIKMFADYYKEKAVQFVGGMNSKQKDAAVDAFMTDPNVMVFIGQITAAGTGINLTESSIMIFNSFSWTAAENKQAEDRIYRITQDKSVTCIYQLFNDSISKHMFEIVRGKEYISETVIKKEVDKDNPDGMLKFD